ncbi:hypothetical protein LY01_02679 [Nonlabens xylanidelens]|uniref:Uncharacterized protein n=1 Tax=Nonlabens xylanidelens TaxID=191564 RepID=A0A2S6IFH7_9FLAO|nr:hypothetical protein [Nonlabens xylanidelens]PPK92975.1 hypothetical protein LY01_02679 [Nonlabens xylanidelens]PQJ18813.1 hypothetical protein BST94_07300 [Nonlabens xylanidelens]
MKKTWGIVGIVLLIAAVTAGKLYKKYAAAPVESKISQEHAQQFIENQRNLEYETQLADQTRKRDSLYQIEKDQREAQMQEMREIRKQLEKEIATESEN